MSRACFAWEMNFMPWRSDVSMFLTSSWPMVSMAVMKSSMVSEGGWPFGEIQERVGGERGGEGERGEKRGRERQGETG